VYAAGDGVLGFYAYGSLAGTAGGLSTLASLQASGELSDDAMELMLGRCIFSPGTKVLLADGSTKPIKDVEVGDVVAATDPEEGETSGKPVTRRMLNLTVADIHTYYVLAGAAPVLVHNRGVCDVWHEGVFGSSEASLQYHYDKHGAPMNVTREQY
jgi:hypothetical protein